jgi:hypothetical protein
MFIPMPTNKAPRLLILQFHCHKVIWGMVMRGSLGSEHYSQDLAKGVFSRCVPDRRYSSRLVIAPIRPAQFQARPPTLAQDARAPPPAAPARSRRRRRRRRQPPSRCPWPMPAPVFRISDRREARWYRHARAKQLKMCLAGVKLRASLVPFHLQGMPSTECSAPGLRASPWQHLGLSGEALQAHGLRLHAMPCHAMPCHAMPCHAMPCHAMA